MKKIDPKAKKSFLIMISLAAALLVIGIGFFVLMYNYKPAADPSIAKMPDMNAAQATDKAEGASNPTEDYAKMAAAADKGGATAAAAAGGAYVPGFAPPPEEVAPKPQSQPAATEPQANQYYTPPQGDASAEKKLNDRQKRLESLATSLLNEGYAPVKSGESWLKAGHEQQSAGGATAAAMPSPAAAGSGRMLIGAGDKVYVSIDTAINTDEPSPVQAQILTGKARGYGMFGQSRHNPNNTISVEFTRMTLPSGYSIPVAAYAIDPKTGRTSVPGSVDYKIFERFVLPAVAAGLGKYGEIVAQQGTQTATSPLAGTTTTTHNMTRQQMRDAAIGAGVGEISSTFTAEAKDAKAAVSTQRNLGIEVTFMQEVIVPEGK